LSDVPLPDECVVVFDLDDTLYPEREFVRSGFRAVAKFIERETGADVYQQLVAAHSTQRPDPFGSILADYRLPFDKQLLVCIYREHDPSLTLAPGVSRLLAQLRASGRRLGLLTDGRSITQRKKLRSLGVEASFDAVVISEEFGSAKPAERNYRHFEQRFSAPHFVYIGNDVTKDFIAPNRLGWQTVCVLDDGGHIHPQEIDKIPPAALPHYWIERLA
jgi:putative hydrolase of the HAD superfamily